MIGTLLKEIKRRQKKDITISRDEGCESNYRDY